jgi:inorganic phosphate transporter, PiT family
VPDWVLLAVAVSFAVVTGVNDGGALVAAGLRVSRLRPVVSLAMLAVALAVGPMLLGTAVAATFTHRLVAFYGERGRYAVVVGVTVALCVVLAFSWRGLPTSLTLATVGGLTGGGAGLGMPVHPGAVAFVLGLGLLAPVLGACGGWALTRLSALLPPLRLGGGVVGRAHPAAFGLECLAYAANDGQKMIAVLALAGGTAGPVTARPGQVVLLAALFAGGVAVGLPRLARSVGGGIFPVRPLHAVAAEVSAAAAVLGSAAVGAPVSMTQSLVGGIVGTGLDGGAGRVRWREVSRLGVAWVLTLPASVLLATAASLLLGALVL